MSDLTFTRTVASFSTKPGPASTKSAEFWSILDLSASDVDFLTLEFAKSEEVQDALKHWQSFQGTEKPSGITYRTGFPVQDKMFTSVCVAETHPMGNPIKFYSPDFRLGPRGLRVGECMFLNRPLAKDGNYRLETIPRHHGRPGFILEWSRELLKANNRGSAFFLCVQLDITEGLRNLAVHKAVHESNAPMLGAPETSAPSFADFDWLAFDDGAGGTNPGPERTLAMTTGILTGMKDVGSEIHAISSMIKQVHSYYHDCFVLVENPSAARTTWSAFETIGLYTAVHFPSSACDLMGLVSELDYTFSNLPVEKSHDVRRGLTRRMPFHLVLDWGQQKTSKQLYFVHISDGRPAAVATKAWACFVVDERSPLVW